jgi:hypothetical protein
VLEVFIFEFMLFTHVAHSLCFSLSDVLQSQMSCPNALNCAKNCETRSGYRTYSVLGVRRAYFTWFEGSFLPYGHDGAVMLFPPCKR